MKAPIIILLLFACCISCTTVRYVPIESSRTDTLHTLQVRYDSIHHLDSVIIRDNGDTIVVEKWRWRERYKIQRDTVYRSQRDTIRVAVPVERSLSRWEKLKQDLGNVALFALAGGILILAIRLIKKLL